MKVGICASGAELALLADSGADYFEEHVQQFLDPQGSEAAFEARLAALPKAPPLKSANCFLPAALKSVGPARDLGALLAYGATAFARARRAGIGTVVFGSGGSRQLPEGFSPAEARAQFVELLKGLGPLAAAQGATLVVEPLNSAECNFINSLDEGAELVRACGHPSVGLLADIYHMKRDGEGPDAILRNKAWLRHAHVAELKDRACPGRHREDLGPYLRALKEAAYRGSVSLECGWSDLEHEAPGALAYFRGQLEAAGL
jgi:sugar phosphate isomerase/epimerase